jgi:hypothetical protein
VSDNARTNGFRIRTLNADCDRLAVQSSVNGTWFCTFHGKLLPKKHEVGIGQNELVILRPHRGKPVIELQGLGGPHGVLIVDRANGGSRTLRNGQRAVFELDAALVLKTENFRPPGRDGSAGMGAV